MKKYIHCKTREESIRANRLDKNKWERGTQEEVDFWDNYAATKGNVFHEDYAFRLDPNTELQDNLKELIKGVDNPLILDIGAGLLTFLGKNKEGNKLDIFAVDALADEYDSILFKYGIEPPVRTQYCDSEDLGNTIFSDKPDLITARNTIDHSYDPIRAIISMVSILKPTGVIYINNYMNTAIHCGWVGLHQWNFYLEKGHLIVESDAGKFDVNYTLDKLFHKQLLSIQNTYDEPSNEITTIIRFK